jgi:xanthine dehydrogenase accessory factor
MRPNILNETVRLQSEGVPFALATIVTATAPTSSKPGDRAIITADAQIAGWIGGSCAQPAVIRQALAALEDGQPRLVMLNADATAGESLKDGIVQIPMTCAGQGALQIFVEPFLPRITLVVVGSSPVARSLVQFGALLDFEVWACDPDANMTLFPDAHRLIARADDLAEQITARHYVIVATFGQYDEIAIQMALASPASYLGLVASQKRLASVQLYLQDRGESAENIARLQRPMGLPGKTFQANEIAFSVLAELIQLRQQRVGYSLEAAPAPRATATDPICGMQVDIATAMYTTERNGQIYYFCCAECQAKFG